MLRETPRALHHDIGGGELPALDPGLRPLHVALELREGGVRLADDALEPRRMALVFGAHLLVEDLDALLRPGEGETGEPQRLAMLDAVRGHEPPALGHLALDVLEDERRIHQHRAFNVEGTEVLADEPQALGNALAGAPDLHQHLLAQVLD